MKEDDVVEQLHQEKNELQTKLDKLEKVLHSLNVDRRQPDGSKFVLKMLSTNPSMCVCIADSSEINLDEYEIVKSVLL